MPGGKVPAAEDCSDLQQRSHGKALLQRGRFALNRNSCSASKPHRPALGSPSRAWDASLEEGGFAETAEHPSGTGLMARG